MFSLGKNILNKEAIMNFEESFPVLAKMLKEQEGMTEEEIQEFEIEVLEKEKQGEKERISRSWKSRGVTQRYWNKNWNNFIVENKKQEEALAKIKESLWKENLLFEGNSGTGKTHLAMAIAKHGGHYKRLPDIFRLVRVDFSQEQKIINNLGSLDLLIIDEVGRQKFSDFEKNLFFEVIDKRWNNCKTTILITNLKPSDFASEYGSAIMDRLRPVRISFDWESRRE